MDFKNDQHKGHHAEIGLLDKNILRQKVGPTYNIVQLSQKEALSIK